MTTSGKYQLPEPPEDLRHLLKDWDGHGIAPAFIADPAAFEEMTGIKVHPKAFKLAPQGCRIVVVREPVPEDYGGIQLPEQYRATESSGIGWVLSAGPLAHLEVPLPYGPIIDHPARLIGQKVIMSQTMGGCVRLAITDRDFHSAVLMMTTRDIWMFDLDPHVPFGEIEKNEEE